MRASVSVDLARPLGEISPMIYGQYLEHVEDCIYPAVSDPGSPLADELGLRRDVIAAAAELGVPVVRWPGGCFADVYHWEDGVGPPDQRPVRRNWHWGGTEPNLFGTDEFLRWCERVGAEPYVNLNLGTGSMDEALRWIDYCVGTDDTADVRRRIANGHAEPYPVRLWGIGNETWGSWEAGAMPAAEYARTLATWADFVKRYRQEARVLAVGSAEGADPDWDRTVLAAAGDRIDYLTHHVYGYALGDDYLPVAFTPVYIEARLRAMAATIAAAGVDVRIAMDEWNIRHFEPDGAGGHRLNRAGPRTLTDAIFAAGVLNALVRLSPTVAMANYVFLVNGNGVLAVRGGELVRSPLFGVFERYGRWMRGLAVTVEVRGPTLPTPEPRADRPGHAAVLDGLPPVAGYLDAAAALDGEHLTVALVNRHPTDALEVRIEGAMPLRQAWTLHHDDVHAVNSVGSPRRVWPVDSRVPDGVRDWRCPPHSVTLLRG